jgi:protease I
MARRAVILAERGFQDEELIYSYYRLLEAGWYVNIASPTGDIVSGKFGVPARVDRVIEDLEIQNYDAVILPGGFEAPDRLRMRRDVQSFVRDMFEAGKLVAAICHGPWILISSGIVKGRRLTGYDSIWPDIKNAGGKLQEEPVVVHGNLITAQHYRDNGAFMKAVVDWKSPEEMWGPELCGAAAANL